MTLLSHRVGKGLEGDFAGEPMLVGTGAFMLELKGKTALVFGVASEDSIAWAICEQLSAAGCKLILGFQKRFMSRVFQLKEKLDKTCSIEMVLKHFTQLMLKPMN